LRDGGRIIDCAFGEKSIRNIVRNLTEAKIDIVEVGFLRDRITYKSGSTFFTDINQIAPYLERRTETTYVAFTDYGMFDYDTLPVCDGTSITGIRVGFLQKDMGNAFSAMRTVKEKGYKLFIQGINSLSYTNGTLMDIIKSANEIEPEALGIVDTYGAMYADDVERLFNLVHDNLEPGIAIGFHSHNNYQLSFSHAQQMIRSCDGKRKLIVDCTLYGMGKEAGNLNTELIIEYLARKRSALYDFDTLLDLIDDEIYPLYRKEFWGYSIPALASGVYKAHPNNVRYLTSKYKLSTKDVKNILSMIDDGMRKSYDYDVIGKTYLDYVSIKTDDTAAVEQLKKQFAGRKVLVLAPGKTLELQRKDILSYIEENNPLIIAINFEFAQMDNTYVFWSGKRRYSTFAKRNPTTKVIISSNVRQHRGDEFVIDYSSITQRTCKHFENAAIMMLRLLQKMQITSLAIAGLDGFDENAQNYAEGLEFSHARPSQEFAEINADISWMLRQYVRGLEGKYPLFFLTPSRFVSDVCAEQSVPTNAIKLLCMDVDGTLTDGGVYISHEGEFEKRFDIKDGYGLVALGKSGIQPILITGRTSEITKRRAEELGIHEVYQNVHDKAALIETILDRKQLSWNNIAYIGDDVNDLECIEKAGFSACPSDAVEAVKQRAKYVCRRAGGFGAVRELCEQLAPEAFRI